MRNKLKMVLFPFLHSGHWIRIREPVGGRLSYRPPIYDINAPDLYIPFMAFGTYVVLAALSLGLNGKFSPEALNTLFVRGLIGWFFQILLLKVSTFSLGDAEAPLLDIVAYAGYTFIGLSITVLGRLIWSYLFYFSMFCACLSTGNFLMKTMNRVLFAEVRNNDSSRHIYPLFFIALVEFPLLMWLGR